jgi:DNA polymerase III subunit delta'
VRHSATVAPGRVAYDARVSSSARASGSPLDSAAAPPGVEAGTHTRAGLEAVLPGVEAHPHARAVLGAALGPRGRPSHAYLLHGPAGVGKRALARAFAAALLADGSPDAEAARAVTERVARGTHPDLTWVTPSGAAEMLVSDIDEPVVAAAARTPFEADRRVFVIEAAETLNEQAANRLLKTLEEPPAYAHLVLVSDRKEEVLATIASRCQHVRFDALAPEMIARGLLAEGACAAGEEEHARACARLALGDAGRARMLAGEEGRALRRAAEGYVRSALAEAGGVGAGERRWVELLEAAKVAGEGAGERAGERLQGELQLAPSKERKKLEREAQEGRRRTERRARARALDRGLQMAELWLRDVVCVQEGAQELVYAVDRRAELAQDAQRCSGAGARRGVELVRETRTRIAVNVSEELALEALAYRLQVEAVA